MQTSQTIANEAKHSGKHLATAMARKRAYKACNRVSKAGPEGKTWYRGRLLNAQQLGLEHRPSRHSPNPQKGNREPRRSNPPGSETQLRTSNQLAILSINLGGITAEGCEEFCQWLDKPETVRNIDVICILAPFF